jgi:translation initiation factor 6
MAIYRYTFYKSPNIGIFVKANDSLILIPHGFADTKSEKLAEYLEVKESRASVAGTRLLGPMSVMNNNGILLPSIASDEEVESIRQASQLKVERVESDNGAIVSPLFRDEVNQQVQDVLGVPAHSMAVGGFVQTGSMIVATNAGAAVTPRASEEEVKAISEILQVPADAVTVNGGMPFLSSGIVANSKHVVVGTLTSGPELIMMSRVFQA